MPRHQLTFADLGPTLAVWAHPDDETYLSGALLAALRDRGERVVCVTATRGEAADPDATDEERRSLAELRTRSSKRPPRSWGSRSTCGSTCPTAAAPTSTPARW